MRTVRTVVAWSVPVTALAAVAVLVGWRLHGGSWVRVTTPSMGTQAPVGSLIWVEPVATGALRAGDLVTFRPPRSEQTYTHLVAAVDPDGTLTTRGAITGADPWRIAPADVRGRAALVWPGVGWLVVSTPLLLAGGLLVWLVVRRLREHDLRAPAAVLGGALVLAAAVVVHRPLLGAQQVSFTPDGASARATYVGTGLLPVRLSTRAGGSVDLRPGEVGSVTAPPDDDGAYAPRFTVTLGPAIGWGWWVALVGACFVPALLTTARRRARRDRGGSLHWTDDFSHHRCFRAPGRRPRAPARTGGARRHRARRPPSGRARAV